jgi:hypothetical protein
LTRAPEREEGTPAWTQVQIQGDKIVKKEYHNLDEDELDALRQEGEDMRALKTSRKKWGVARTQSITMTIDHIQDQVGWFLTLLYQWLNFCQICQLYTRTRMIASTQFYCSNTAINYDARLITGYDPADQYFTMIAGKTPNEFAVDMDLWAINRFRSKHYS